jgi:hypothetical protein
MLPNSGQNSMTEHSCTVIGKNMYNALWFVHSVDAYRIWNIEYNLKHIEYLIWYVAERRSYKRLDIHNNLGIERIYI